jgi:hypothetical protein
MVFVLLTSGCYCCKGLKCVSVQLFESEEDLHTYIKERRSEDHDFNYYIEECKIQKPKVISNTETKTQ